MKLFKTFKPVNYIKYQGRKSNLMNHLTAGLTKSDVMHVKNSLCDKKKTHVYCYTDNGKLIVRLFNMVKHNRRIERMTHGKNIVHHLYWEVWVYDVPAHLLFDMNLRAVQGDRNFKIIDLDDIKNC